MKNEEVKVKRVKEPENIGQRKGDSFRVVISQEANEQLEKIVTKILNGFSGGSITKSDVADYVFINLTRMLNESDFKTIRSLHFDDKKMLGTLLKNDDELPEDLKRALRNHYGVVEKEKRRYLRSQNDLSTDAHVDNPSTQEVDM